MQSVVHKAAAKQSQALEDEIQCVMVCSKFKASIMSQCALRVDVANSSIPSIREKSVQRNFQTSLLNTPAISSDIWCAIYRPDAIRQIVSHLIHVVHSLAAIVAPQLYHDQSPKCKSKARQVDFTSESESVKLCRTD